MQTVIVADSFNRYRLLKFWQFNAYKKAGKGLQVTSRVQYVTDPDKPHPWEHVTKGARPCCAALEKRKRKQGVHVKIYSYMNRDSVF